jgi:hypothetical protein
MSSQNPTGQLAAVQPSDIPQASRGHQLPRTLGPASHVAVIVSDQARLDILESECIGH